MHTSRDTATMYTKFCISQKIFVCFTFCCLSFGGCASQSDTKTRTSISFSRSPQTSAQTSEQTSPIIVSTSQASNLAVSPFDLVVEQFADFVNWRRECGYKPKFCDTEKFTIRGTEFGDSFATMIESFAKNNIYARPGNGERKITIQEIAFDDSKMTASINGCVYDTTVLYMGSGIYDDKITSSFSIWTLHWLNNRWFWTDYQISKKVFFENLCET